METRNIIDSSFQSGKNFKIGSFCIIEEGCQVGDDVEIGNYTILHAGVKINNGTKVGSYCEIGKRVAIGKNSIIQGRIRTGDDCTIEDDVTIKYGTILTASVLLKRGCFLGPNVITLGSTHKRVTVHGTIIGNNTYVGAGSKIAGGVELGNDITIGALAFVKTTILDSGIYVGTPVRKIK